MHKYLNAIGFHDIASEREWYQILLESEKNFSGYDRIALDEHTDLCELRREYGNGIGISSYGFIDENDEAFRRECYFPYFSGSGVSSYAVVTIPSGAAPASWNPSLALYTPTSLNIGTFPSVVPTVILT